MTPLAVADDNDALARIVPSSPFNETVRNANRKPSRQFTVNHNPMNYSSPFGNDLLFTASEVEKIQRDRSLNW